ncbi:ABC transporter substrate-binding protein [Azorhizobium oxalatiphilum]|uniref:ABC transporter substrate-binding protein n=1 Tax=Azorhizobium oxalatiphilum TaxID=980631 RepID=A0A917BTK7_9HYPH|nr:ABC transporter substrate-binding protein [Azorhizobium oxalatiphilum]GGF58243.1 ABC transporter substrate-binding protein [Azorhizobium oxalatiphilum]
MRGGGHGLSRRSCLTALLSAALCPLPASAQAAPRIAAADWAGAESLLALGIAPLAVSDTGTYRDWLPEIPLPDGVPDLGSRAEPNMEQLAALRPELILISNWQANLKGLLGALGPTETISIIVPRTDPLENARTALTRLGARLGREREAAAYLAAFDAALDGFARTMARQAEPHPVYVGVLHENGTQVFLYGPGSWVQTVMDRLGLRNALDRPTSAFGNALVDLAQFAATPEATLLYLDQGARTRRAERLLSRSTLWQALPMVQAGRVRAIPPFYALGGVPSVWRCVRLLSDALMPPDRG